MKKQLPKLNYRALLVPTEHGIWSFWLEPSLLGLFLAPSLSGFLLTISALAGLFTQHPLALYLADLRRKKRFARTVWVKRFSYVYGFLALSFFSLSLLSSSSYRYVYVLGPMMVLAAYQFNAKLQNKAKALLPELAGVSAMAGIVTCILLMGEYSSSDALLIGLLVLLRNLGAILYVRTRLRLERSKAVLHWPSIVAASTAVMVTICLFFLKQIGITVVILFALLMFRTLWGQSKYRRPLQAKQIGMLELFYGLIFVFLMGFS